MPDIATIWDPDSGTGDWVLSVPQLNLLVDENGNSVVDDSAAPIWTDIEAYTAGTGLLAGNDLVTAVLISLFTDATADTEDTIPDGTTDPRGWWAGDIGSKFWLRTRSKQTPTVLALVKSDFANALQWLLDDGVAADETRATEATGDQLTVANALYDVQPVTVLLYSVAPEPNTVNLTIAGISGVSTSVKNAIAAAFASALQTGAVPGGTTNISAIQGAIESVPGSAGFVLTNVAVSNGTVTPGSAGNIQSAGGYLPVPGTITYA
ncbi:phage GP46 family protein [Flavisphingomonas formosensis]|uniref:phage GP46 family protein n=1 Tax=Flavisphingomonas formosensis TaxID=861534 RepID=UPI0012F9BE82|nr:phage GP46 family protein [Sphingomonas formosensis]